MVAARTCCRGLSLGTAVRIYGITRLVDAPDFGVYEFAWSLHATASGPVAVIAGASGLIGLQKGATAYLGMYRNLKLSQIIFVFSACIVVLSNLELIGTQLADEVIDKNGGIPPPFPSKEKLVLYLMSKLQSSAFASMGLWFIFGGYGLYIISSMAVWMGRGSDPNSARFFVTLPLAETSMEEGTRVQYVSPLLQGQSPTIPISVQ